jgi:ABC-type transport system involved in cytochrome c biogenesis permease subunit
MTDQEWEAIVFACSLAAVVCAWIAAIAGQVWATGAGDPGGDRRSRRMVRRAFWVLLVAGLLGQMAVTLSFSVRRGTFAVFNQAEFLLAFSWCVGLAVCFFMRRRGPWWIAILTLPLSFLTLGYILLIPPQKGEVSLASLRSIWLLLHILTSVVAYAAFTVTFAAGVMLLARRYLGLGEGYDPATVNRVGYRAAVFGFPFMTMVLFTGALWAKYRGGVYWSWDPIETWALVTWLIYAAYLHAQYTRGWEGVRAAWLSVVGFACVVSTYLFFTHFWF